MDVLFSHELNEICFWGNSMWGCVVVGGRLIDERDECVLPQS